MTLSIQKLECFKLQDSLLSQEAHFSFNIYKILEVIIIIQLIFRIIRIFTFLNQKKKVFHVTTIDRGRKLGTILTQIEHRQITSNIQKIGKMALHIFQCLQELLSKTLKNINLINMLEVCQLYSRMVNCQNFK